MFRFWNIEYFYNTVLNTTITTETISNYIMTFSIIIRFTPRRVKMIKKNSLRNKYRVNILKPIFFFFNSLDYFCRTWYTYFPRRILVQAIISFFELSRVFLYSNNLYIVVSALFIYRNFNDKIKKYVNKFSNISIVPLK